jgi:4a-hydroxytetrahydrobiopterin dehydratase
MGTATAKRRGSTRCGIAIGRGFRVAAADKCLGVEHGGMASAELAERECEACTSDDDPLEGEELEELHDQVDQNVWDVVDEHHLEGTYAFEDFGDALEFAYEVGELAEEEWHHPDIHLSWGEVVVEMWTHKIDGLFETDFVMAARMDRIYEEGDYEPDEED